MSNELQALAEQLDEQIREIAATFATKVKEAVTTADAVAFLQAKRQYDWQLQDALDQHNQRMASYYIKLQQI